MIVRKLILSLILFAAPAAAQWPLQASPTPAPYQIAQQYNMAFAPRATPTATPTAGALHYTDSFTRSVNTDLNANCAGNDHCEWTEIGADTKGINASNQYITSADGTGRAVNNDTNESTGLSQYVAARFVGTVAGTSQGITLRDEGVSAGDQFFYYFAFSGSGSMTIRAGMWGASISTITTITTSNVGPADATFASGDSMGVEVDTGTGNDITFTIYHWAAQSPPSHGSWTDGRTICASGCDEGFGTTPTDTGRNSDVGKRGGFLNQTDNQQEWDDWMFGDNPTPTPTATPTASPTPTATPLPAFMADANIQGCWLMSHDDETDAEADLCGDTNGDANNLQWEGTTGWAVTESGGPDGQDVTYLDGGDNYLGTTTNDERYSANDLTMGCWAAWTIAGDDAVIIQSQDLNGASLKAYNNTYRLEAWWDGALERTSPAISAEDTWTHLVMRHKTDGTGCTGSGEPYDCCTGSGAGCEGEIEMIVGGDNFVCQGGCTEDLGAFTGAQYITIGGFGTFDNIDGKLHHCWMFDRALTDVEICKICRFDLDGLASDRGDEGSGYICGNQVDTGCDDGS